MSATHYLWDFASDNLLMEKDGSGNTIATYTNEPRRLGELISQRRDAQTYYHHYDADGNTRVVTVQNENVVETATYSAFGEVVEKMSSIVNPFGYKGSLGYYASSGTDDLDVRVRIYRPINGRWLSIDPFGFAVAIADEVNLYGYARNSPLIARALTGLLQMAPKGKKSTVTLDCPAYGCTGGPCKFELSFEPKVQPNGALAAGTKICFSQQPGEYDPDENPPPKNRPDICQSEINRNLKKNDHITITLLDGTPCEFTEGVFPPKTNWPPIPGRVPPACEQIMTPEGEQPPRGGPSKGGCYVITQDVKSICLNFTMDISCFCETCKGFGEHRDTIKLSACAP